MPLMPPKFWNESNRYFSYFLEPISWLYRGGAVLHQIFSRPYRASVPVVSIGNLVLGGAGKTPLTITLAQTLQAMGYTPHIISRGYGGSLYGPVRVDVAQHQFHQVGDESLLLAKYAPTWVSKNRRSAVNLAIESGANILLLDDAHQNYTLEKDLSFVVVNGLQGFGNGRVFPAGPLRQSMKAGLKGATAIVYISQKKDPLPGFFRSFPCPLIRATIAPISPNPCPVLAFAGIGYPAKFHHTLLEAGYQVKAFIPFPDHYVYTHEDLCKLRMRASVEGASLITTEKDVLRIPPSSRQDVLVLPVELTFYPKMALESLLKKLLNELKV